MRRFANLTLASAVATAAALGLTVHPAAAHFCAAPVEIAVGPPASIQVGVTVEGSAVPDVAITIPAGLRLDRVDGKAGWTQTRNGSTVRFHGGPIAPYACAYFSFGVTATARGAFGIPVTETTADGRVVARSNPDPSIPADRLLGQIVYAGVQIPANPSSSGGPSVTTIAGIALVGLGVVMVGFLLLRSRRDRRPDDDEGGDDPGGEGDEDDRDAELRARVERFKKRTPDPRSPD